MISNRFKNNLFQPFFVCKKCVQTIFMRKTLFIHYRMLNITPQAYFKIIKTFFFFSPPQQVAFGDFFKNNTDLANTLNTTKIYNKTKNTL